MTIIVPRSNVPVVDEGNLPTFLFSQFMLDVARMSPEIGSGSPEGIISAVQWQTYIDEDGSTGSIKYIKKYADIGGDTTKGWILE